MSSETIQPLPTLIVDDSRGYLEALSRMLVERLGFTDVVCVASCAEAHEAIAADPDRFRLLLLDYSFPRGQSGADLMRTLAGFGLLRGKAVLFISADPTPEKLAEVKALGALGLVVKPFDQRQLSEQLLIAQRCLRCDEQASF